MSRPLPVVVAFVLLLSGCGQIATPDTASETTTVAPQEVGNQTGITASRVYPATVAANHADSLATQTYTVRITQRTETAEGRLLRRTHRYREVGRGGDAYRGFVRYNTSVDALREFGTIGYWRNETHVATRFKSPLRPVQTALWPSERSGPVPAPSNAPGIQSLLRTTSPTVETRYANGTVVLAGTAPAPEKRLETPPELTDFGTLSTRFHVRADGIVTRWWVTYEATFRDRTVSVVRTGRITDIGDTVVERPQWLANATTFDTETAPVSDLRRPSPRTRSAPGIP
jgi:hypothetical protein